MELGYALSSEEWGPRDLVKLACRAEDAGFSFALVSDHYHPWTDRQGNSPFVWAVIGAVAQATKRLRLGTGVTCPINRIHPAILAQAAATAALLMPGRFFLGVGSGENLNEHITAFRWPEPPVRLEMLREAVKIIRTLWRGGFQSYRGRYFTVENARVYNLPETPTPICVAAVTCLMPGATETDFFERAGMLDTKVGTQKKDDAAEVAKIGFDAMMAGKGDVVSGWHNKLRSAIANVLPAGLTAELHRGMAAPGSAK
jgi:G6PDH family F420-dependent oxidoreductase